MKTVVSILIIYAAFLLCWPINAHCEDSASSGVIVIGPTGKSSSGTQTPEVVSSENEDSSKSGENGPASAPFYEISGSKIGDTRVSQGVTLPSEGEVMFVDAGIAGAFTIVRVDKNGKETQALSTSPERAMGQKLAKGTYKVYPEDFDGRFPFDKLTVKVQVRVAENVAGGAQ